jgi:predicted Fe-Mo cluster-binding NifX family protein
MNVAVTAQGTDLDSEVDPRFGRARFFIVIDTQTGAFSVHDNTPNLNAPQGAGVQAAQTVINLGVEAVITGHIGPKAFSALKEGNIKMYVAAAGSVSNALNQFKLGQGEWVSGPNAESHRV